MRLSILLVLGLVALASAVSFSGEATVRLGDSGKLRDATVRVADDKLEIEYDFGVFEQEVYSEFSRYQTCPSGQCSTIVIKYPEVNWNYRTGGSSDGKINGISVTRYSYVEEGVTVQLWVRSNNNIVRVEQNGPGVNRQITFKTYSTASFSFQADLSACDDVQCDGAIDLMLVMDTSGSINADEFIQEQDYALEIISRFQVSSNGVHIGLVNFSTDVDLVSSLTSSQTNIEATINNLEHQKGLTAIGGAIQAAADELNTNGRANIPRIIMLLTDGEANVPSPGAKAFARQNANNAKDAGIILYVVGVGDEINEEELTNLASPPSNGLTYTAFVENFDQLAGTVNTLLTTVCVGGDDALCRVECSDDEFCGCDECVCTLQDEDCPFNGQVDDDCTCKCTGLYKEDCSGCLANPCVRGTQNDLCQCECPANTNWEGLDCNTCLDVCNGPNEEKAPDCKGCQCKGDWTGADCQTCSRDCGAGVHVDCTTCDCTNSARKGSHCSECQLACVRGSHNPACTKCNCPSNKRWTGTLCDTCNTEENNIPYCSSRGKVTTANGCSVCDCPAPWTGNQCQTCSFSCNNNGSPDLTTGKCNSCTCTGAYDPADHCLTCKTTNRDFCNGRGNPDSNTGCVKCTCDVGEWEGDKCNVCDFMCHDGNHNDNCDGCKNCGTTNWVGTKCDHCPEEVENHVYCTSHGRLVKVGDTCDTCECNTHWSGDNCEKCVYPCNGGEPNDTCDGCKSCPGALTPESDCAQCDMSDNHPYCGGIGSIADANNCEVCQCPTNWQGNSTCTKCSLDCHGGDVVNCESCENCPGAYLESSQCTMCDDANPSDYCNGVGFVSEDQGDCDTCECYPDSNKGGKWCHECIYTCPNGSSRNTNCDGCECSSDSAYTGNDCDLCDVSDLSNFCNGRGHVNNEDSGCDECECTENRWEGQRCDECNFTCNGHGAPSDDCTVCECIGQYDPSDACHTCLLPCGEHSHHNEACDACVCDDRYGGPDCAECDAGYSAQCRNGAVATLAEDCQCDCTDLFSGEFCDECDADNIDCGVDGFLDQVEINGQPTCRCECSEYVVGQYCQECGLDFERDDRLECPGIAVPEFSNCTCRCPDFYENTEGCQVCLIEEHDCKNGGSNADQTVGVCACECPSPWQGPDCSVCPETLCPDTPGVYLDTEKCECYSICEDGFIALEEECEIRLAQDSKDEICCHECKIREVPCNDGIFCTQGEKCSPEGICEGGSIRQCPSDDNVCTRELCEAQQDKCISFNLDNQTDCDDGNPCTLKDVCIEGVCKGEDRVCNANESNPCIQDFCNTDTGNCDSDDLDSTTPCDDGNPCTIGDHCDGAGTCVSGDPVPCDTPADPCLDNKCVNGKCEIVNRVGFIPCDDGNACTSQDKCVEGVCQGEFFCAVADPCKTGECTDGVCSVRFNDDPCDDGTACTRNDRCVDGICQGETFSCPDDGDPCTEPFCALDGSCGFIASNENGSCDDGNLCTEGDKCHRGICRGTPKCVRDNDPCTDDGCNPLTGQCEYPFIDSGVDCDDGDQCTITDVCGPGGCKGTDVSCRTDNPCVEGKCVDGDCQFFATDEANKACDDGDPCTYDDVCVGRRCKGTPRNCQVSDKCSEGYCDAETGQCEIRDAVTCVPRNTCESARCVNGVCEYTPNECNDFDACTDDMCEDGTCKFMPYTCPEDNDVCTTAVCVDDNGSRQCKQIRETCEDRDGGCMVGTCDAVDGCVYTKKNCDDGIACTEDECEDGTCLHSQIVCGDDDDNQCTIPECEPSTGECVDRERDCSYLDDDEDDDDCNQSICENGACTTRNECGPTFVPPPIVVPPTPVVPAPTEIGEETPPQPSPVRTPVNGTAGGGNAGARPLTQDEAAEVLTSIPVNLVATGLASGGVVVIFLGGLVLAFNNSKQQPQAPDIASLVDVEMVNAAHENPVFAGQVDANLNIIHGGA